jgi:hypothetical protein
MSYNLILRSKNKRNGIENNFTIDSDLLIPYANKYKIKLNEVVIKPYPNNNKEANDGGFVYFDTDFIELHIDNIGSSNLYDNGHKNSLVFFFDNDFNPQWLNGNSYFGNKQCVYTSKTEYIIDSINLRNLSISLYDSEGEILVDNGGDGDPSEPDDVIISMSIEPID